MVVENLKPKGYQSKEAQLMVLKQRADKVSSFISGLRKSKGKVYLQIMSDVSGVEALITLQSLLLQISLYSRKFSDLSINDFFEVARAHEALAIYYKEKNFMPLISYLKEIKTLFTLVKE